ncbi:hypothetical protein HT576_05535 [Haloterrigena sp. SYSU A121-1]|uniref:CHAT domain-containing protein n=1 Tax=Haloterrigena gelatinilytica TaxID=2741724 RepID=A0A8J8KGW7_9EURY|nr:hypothetical protein [Haloterrigena gelatinilytica]NUB90494.1 hypothetical protein [Haloterrigena gelatinilytica]
MKPKFEPLDDGLEIIDPIERHRYRLTTHERVDPEPVDPERIQFPVTTAVEVTTEMITLPTNESVYIRDEDGAMISEVRPNKQSSLPADTYTLDLSGPLKVYARVESSVYIYSDSERTYITLDESTRTTIGVRSYHRRPAGTITTTSDPTDVMEAISTFGSALKSTTPERSYPTLRGHPPVVELGSELSIPDEFDRPDTNVQIEVPSDLGNIFVVTPLAYYLGAEVITGSEPQLTTERGFTFDLDGKGGLESTVERLLKQLFFLDCVARTEGTTPLPLHERQRTEPKLEFSLENVYNMDPVDRIKEYLTVDYSAIESFIPKWRATTELHGEPSEVESLPFLADSLSIVNILEGPTKQVGGQIRAIEGFTRNSCTRNTESSRGTSEGSTSNPLPDTTTIKQYWDCLGTTSITGITPLSAFYNSIEQTPREDPIEIIVICNDSEMMKELKVVNDIYGNRAELPFDVSIYYNTTTEQLKSVLLQKTDFLHFIGHIDEVGFQCTNGKLDIADVGETNVKAFFLNSCQSHDQGLQLVNAGSIGGIVTFSDVINNSAVKIGETIARLLNRGFPLHAALDIARKDSVVGEQYCVVGDSKTTIAQSETAPPFVCLLESRDDTYSMRIDTYTKKEFRKGSLFIPYLDGEDDYFLVSGRSGDYSLSREQLADFLEMEMFPVVIDENVVWSQDINVDCL